MTRSSVKVALLIAFVLASVVLADSYWFGSRRRRRSKGGVIGRTFIKKEEAFEGDVAKLEGVVHDVESKAALELMREFQEVEGNNGDLNGDVFQNKVATLQEAAAEMEEKVNEVEEYAALGLLEEELEELEEELKEVKDDPDE